MLATETPAPVAGAVSASAAGRSDSRRNLPHQGSGQDAANIPSPRARSARTIRCLGAAAACLLLFAAVAAQAAGGTVLAEDRCIVQIDFYSVHFTAYQPDARGNEQFCQDLPGTGATIFVLDYLHRSLSEVPVDFRIVRDFTGQGRFAKLKHISDAGAIERHTVFYQAPVVRPDASLTAEYSFPSNGDYLAIISAGHPSGDQTYVAVFPLSVGRFGRGYLVAALAVAVAAAGLLAARWRRAAVRARPGAAA